MPEDREYHNIEHNFLGRSLFTQEKNSLPIITVVIYCYVLRQLGLRAAPCDFPLHVHAIVHPPPGIDLQGNALPPDATDEPTLYMDPFRSSTPTPISSLHEQLHFLANQLPSADHAAFLCASTPSSITIRCARNILYSLQHSTERPTGPPIDQHSAQYAALWALVLLPTSTLTLRHQLHMLIDLVAEKYPHDIALVEKHILPPIARSRPQHAQTCRTVRAADQNAPSSVKRRAETHKKACDSIKFRVGQVFKHRRYGYTAVVAGWDAKCDAGEEWIRRMNVDRLDGGRTQAFYHALYVSSHAYPTPSLLLFNP
jgi:F-box protein 21